MRIREQHPFPRELIDVRRWNFPSIRIVTLDISIAEIVCIDDNDIGAIRLTTNHLADQENKRQR